MASIFLGVRELPQLIVSKRSREQGNNSECPVGMNYVSSNALTKNSMLIVGVARKRVRFLQFCVSMASRFVHSYNIKVTGL